jgi:two-component sensor histidine kinase
MALIHETLYQSEGLDRVDLGAYLRGLVGQLVRSAELEGGRIAVQVAAERVQVSIDIAMPRGLILNELVSNALKHAFPEGRGGIIRLSVRTDADSQVILQVRDTGVGLPPELDPRDLRSLGLQLVYSLTEQLNGTLTVDSHGGTAFTLTFPA